MMNLEIEDYQKTLDNLQIKLEEREKQYRESQDEIGSRERRLDDAKAQIGRWSAFSVSQPIGGRVYNRGGS